MSRSARYLLNALVLLLIAGHGIWWFATGRGELAPDTTVWLRAAQVIVGLAGAIWLFSRSRGAANRGS